MNKLSLSKEPTQLYERLQTASHLSTEALHKNKETAKLRIRLRSVQVRLDAFRGRYEKAMDEIGLMDKNFEEASSKLKKQLASYGVEILRLKKELASKD